jgi:tRNA-dihydrouridine synthase
VAQIADDLGIPVFGSGDCVEPDEILARLRLGVSGVLVGRGVLRNPWILAQAAALARGETPAPVTLQQRGEFLRAYIRLLLDERVSEATASAIAHPAAR